MAETPCIKWSIIMVILCLYINWMYKMFINYANKFILNVSDCLMLACVFIQMNFPVGLKMEWSIYWNKIEDYKNCFGNIILNWLAAFPLSAFIKNLISPNVGFNIQLILLSVCLNIQLILLNLYKWLYYSCWYFIVLRC